MEPMLTLTIESAARIYSRHNQSRVWSAEYLDKMSLDQAAQIGFGLYCADCGVEKIHDHHTDCPVCNSRNVFHIKEARATPR